MQYFMQGVSVSVIRCILKPAKGSLNRLSVRICKISKYLHRRSYKVFLKYLINYELKIFKNHRRPHWLAPEWLSLLLVTNWLFPLLFTTVHTYIDRLPALMTFYIVRNYCWSQRYSQSNIDTFSLAHRLTLCLLSAGTECLLYQGRTWRPA
jgi:hypothetical protein